MQTRINIIDLRVLLKTIVDVTTTLRMILSIELLRQFQFIELSKIEWTSSQKFNERLLENSMNVFRLVEFSREEFLSNIIIQKRTHKESRDDLSVASTEKHRSRIDL